MAFSLNIKTSIWNKEINTIYDYSATWYDTTYKSLNKSTLISRDKNDINYNKIKEKTVLPFDETLVSDILIENGKYTIISQNNSKFLPAGEHVNNWISLNKTKIIGEKAELSVYNSFISSNAKKKVDNENSNVFELRKGDVFKLGKIMFRVLDKICMKEKNS